MSGLEAGTDTAGGGVLRGDAAALRGATTFGAGCGKESDTIM